MWLLCQRSAGPDGSAAEREEVDRCATPVGRTGGGRRSRLPMGAVLPAAPAVAIQTLPKIKVEKGG